MINPFEQINWQPKDKDIKSFGKSMIIGFACIAAIFFLVQIFRTPFNKAIVMPLCLLGFGVLMFLLTRIVPKLTLPVYYVWFFVSERDTDDILLSHIHAVCDRTETCNRTRPVATQKKSRRENILA